MAVSIYLKGSIQAQIGADGVITKTVTWIVMPVSAAPGFSGWIAFEDEVKAWAGNIGDYWKKPVEDEAGGYSTSFTLDSTFIVSNISYNSVNRTHYEVTFEVSQNFEVLQSVGNVSVSVNNNNERTKTLNYRLILPIGSSGGNLDPAAIDPHLFDSGDIVEWGSGLYVIESSDYSDSGRNQYQITVVARDMAKLMLGLPTINEDAFGQRTMSIVWRMAVSVYMAETLPVAGDNIGTWFGARDDSADWVISSVSSTAEGVLGYLVSFEAKHIAKKRMRVSRSAKKESNGAITNSNTIIYRMPGTEDFDAELARVGDDATSEGYPGQTIVDVGVEQAGANDHEMTIKTSDNLGDSAGYNIQIFTPSALASQVDINCTPSRYYLSAQQCGYFKTGQGLGYEVINAPSQIKVQASITPEQLKKSNSEYWTDAQILTSAKEGNLYGEEIIRIKDPTGKDIFPASFNSLTSTSGHVFITNVFVYAQPGYPNGTAMGMKFIPWEAATQCPIRWDKTGTWPKISGTTLDAPLPRHEIGHGLPMMDCTVTLNYHRSVPDAIAADWSEYYADAKDKIMNPKLTSYKMRSPSFSKVTDTNGSEWTQVTVTIQALMGADWNFSYTTEDYEDGA